jgi:hypothetical protein
MMQPNAPSIKAIEVRFRYLAVRFMSLTLWHCRIRPHVRSRIYVSNTLGE